jgi:mycothiol synthase
MPRSEGAGEDSAAAQVTVGGPLSAADASAVLGLAGAAARTDGVAPLSEHVLLHLRYGGDAQARDLLLTAQGELSGYAHLDPAGPGGSASGELVIHPGRRGHGLGLLLGRQLEAAAGEALLRVWAHGDLPAAARLAAAAGFERARSLWQMRRSLQPAIGSPRIAEGVTIRTFAVGRDEDAWTALNARAFASHPEQGTWTREDLEVREREPWFDPGGFFLAERDGKLVGFHWTKVHATEQEEAVGEVYVVGVDPDERGTGLGRALTLVGLRYLRSRGLPEVMLYVDESNTPAIGMYESLGFSHHGTDVMYARPSKLAQTDVPAARCTPRT